MCQEEPEVLDDKLEAGSQAKHTGWAALSFYPPECSVTIVGWVVATVKMVTLY